MIIIHVNAPHSIFFFLWFKLLIVHQSMINIMIYDAIYNRYLLPIEMFGKHSVSEYQTIKYNNTEGCRN